METQNKKLIQLQSKLQVSHDKYSDLYDLAPMAYFTCNPKGLILDVNQSGLHLLGLSKKMILGRNFSRFIVPEFHLLFSTYRKQILNDENSLPLEIKLLRWSELSLDVQLSCKMVQSADSVKPKLLICITDIAHKNLQNNTSHLQRIKISSADRMHSVQTQIDLIAENQNHFLTIMNNYVLGCINKMDLDNFNKNEILTMLKKTVEQSYNLVNIIKKTKNFTTKNLFHYEFLILTKLFKILFY